MPHCLRVINMVGTTYIASDQRQQLLCSLDSCSVLRQHSKITPLASTPGQSWRFLRVCQISAFSPSLL